MADKFQIQALSQLSQKLAEFTVNFELSKAPEKALENAKMAILDCLGVAIRAVSDDIGKALLRFARHNLASGPCTVWGSDLTTNPRDAALMNGTLAHGLDYDDRGHASTYTLATSLAAAESCGASGAKTLEAFIAGREVRSCLDAIFAGRSSGHGPGARGWHSNGIIGPIGSACSASKILGLDVKETLTAIGLAAGSCGALTRDGGTMAKPFRCGQAAATGLTCALLAREGFTSDETPLEGPFGLLSALGSLDEGILNSLSKDLSTEFHLVKTGIKVKQFSCCTASHASIEAVLRLKQNRPVSPSDVDFIECDLHPYPLVRAVPKRGFEGRFSMPYLLAIALIYGSPTPEKFTDELVNDPQVRNLVGRARHVPGLKSVILNLKDGKRFEEPIQPPVNLREWAAIREKFNQCVEKALPHGKPAAVIASVEHLEKIETITSLTHALRG